MLTFYGPMDIENAVVAVVVVLGGIIVACGIAIAELRDRLRALERQTVTDPLTGAFTRGHLEACLGAAVERRIRFGEPACLVKFDVDRFRDINDTMGRPVGDAALKALVALVGRRARKLDVLCRVGGEEFALLLSGARITAAVVIAEELRLLVADAGLIDGHPMSISVGVSELRGGQSPPDWVDDADRALLCAKRSGRNRVAWSTRTGAAAVDSGIVDVRPHDLATPSTAFP
jgi:diguanylate cyclase (GGDEF)-like protein